MADRGLRAASTDDPDLGRQRKVRRRQLRKLRAAHKSGDVEAAVAQAERMGRRYPHDPEVRSEIAATFLAADELDRAIRSWEEAIELEPDDWRTRYRLSEVLIALGRNEDALEVLAPVGELLPAGAPSLRLAGLYRELGSEDRALGILRRLVASDPGYRAGWDETIALLEEAGRRDEAEETRRARDEAIPPKLSTAEVVQRIDGHHPGDARRYVVNVGCRDGRHMDPCFDLYQAGYPGLAVDAGNHPMVHLNLPSPDVRKLLNTALTPTNVVEILEREGCPRRFSLLKIDIDSYDGVLLEAALEDFEPSVIQIEVNPQIPPPLRFAIQYDERYRPSGKHGFFGCSVAFVTALCRPRGYELLQIDGRDIILVKNDYLPLWDVTLPVDERELFLREPPVEGGGFSHLGVDPAAWRDEPDPHTLLSQVWDACIAASVNTRGEVLPFILTL